MKRQWRPGAKGWIAVLVVAALLISACAKATPTPTPPKAIPTPTPVAAPGPAPVVTPVATPVAKPRPTGELRMAVSSFGTEALDPTHIPTSGQIYLAPMYDHLVGMGADGKYSKETGVARDWEPSPDGKTWTFYLRQGVKFHDGTELTAEDVKFSLERFMRTGPTSFVSEKLGGLVNCWGNVFPKIEMSGSWHPLTPQTLASGTRFCRS